MEGLRVCALAVFVLFGCIAAATYAGAQSQMLEQTLRLMCEGIRESGDDPANMKRESLTIQLEISPTGFVNSHNLVLYAHKQSTVLPKFHVEPDAIDFYAQYDTDESAFTSRFDISRLTGVAHEAQSISPKQGKLYVVTGEYRCRKVDKLTF
jgi:hypothetical protein